MITKADYDELVRLQETYGVVAYRNPLTHKIIVLGVCTYLKATDGTLAFIEDGKAIHIPSAIAEYERAQEGK